MLDNVAYLGPDPNRPSRGGKYKGEIGERQLAFGGSLRVEIRAQRDVHADYDQFVPASV